MDKDTGREKERGERKLERSGHIDRIKIDRYEDVYEEREKERERRKRERERGGERT